MLTLKNRIVRSATNEHLSETDGQVTRAWADALIELAAHEVGLVISGHFCVDASQRPMRASRYWMKKQIGRFSATRRTVYTSMAVRS